MVLFVVDYAVAQFCDGSTYQRFRNWFFKNTKIPRPSKLVEKYRHLFKFICDLIGISYVSQFFGFPDFHFSRFHHRKNIWKRSEKPIVFGFKTIRRKYRDVTPIQNSSKGIGTFQIDFWFNRIYLRSVFVNFQISKNRASTIVKFFGNAWRNQMFWAHQILKTNGYFLLVSPGVTTFWFEDYIYKMSFYVS